MPLFKRKSSKELFEVHSHQQNNNNNVNISDPNDIQLSPLPFELNATAAEEVPLRVMSSGQREHSPPAYATLQKPSSAMSKRSPFSGSNLCGAGALPVKPPLPPDEYALSQIPPKPNCASATPWKPIELLENDAMHNAAGTSTASPLALAHANGNGHGGHHHAKSPVTLQNGTLSTLNGVNQLNPAIYPTHSEYDGDETDDEIAQTFSRAMKSVHVIIPSKAQVLLYFANANTFNLRRIGTDLQVTDASDYPLFDVWVDMDCCRATWVIEAYGRVVMTMHEKASNICCGARRPPITMSDWNGDLFGYLVPGDPFLLQSPDRQTIAKLMPHSMGAMDRCASSTSLGTASTNGTAGQPANGATSATLNGNGSTPEDSSRLCWLCVMEGTGRHIVRLEGFDHMMFNKDVSFQMKLLALAAMIRLSAPWNMPRRGDGDAIGGFWSTVSSFLNFFAYCLY